MIAGITTNPPNTAGSKPRPLLKSGLLLFPWHLSPDRTQLPLLTTMQIQPLPLPPRRRIIRETLTAVKTLLRAAPLSLLSLLALMLFARDAGSRTRSPHPLLTVLPCEHIRLSAQYLSQVAPGSGPGFHFHLENETPKPVKLAMPVPSSAHWFAEEGGRWLWRASNGAGGSLVNAHQEKGPMFAYQPHRDGGDPAYLVVAPRASQEWDETLHDNSVLLFKPSCALCNHPDDRLYRVVFGYAYLPLQEETNPGVITCGLRSNFVDVPPAVLRK